MGLDATMKDYEEVALLRAELERLLDVLGEEDVAIVEKLLETIDAASPYEDNDE